MVCTPDTLWWVGGSKVGKMPDDGALDVCVSVNKFCETCSTVAEVSTVASPSWDASISPPVSSLEMALSQWGVNECWKNVWALPHALPSGSG